MKLGEVLGPLDLIVQPNITENISISKITSRQFRFIIGRMEVHVCALSPIE